MNDTYLINGELLVGGYPRTQIDSYPRLFRLLEVAHEMLSIPYEDRFIFYNDDRQEYRNSDCLKKQDASSPDFHRFAVEARESDHRIVVNLIAFFNADKDQQHYLEFEKIKRDINIVLLQEKFRCSTEVEYKAYTEGQDLLNYLLDAILCRINEEAVQRVRERIKGLTNL